MKPHPAATAALKRKLGPALVLTDEASLPEVSYDSSKILFRPAAAIRVRKEAEVGVVLELANRDGVPVTTRGRGTTLTGGAAPVHGGWVLDTLALDQIGIDDEAGMRRCRPVRRSATSSARPRRRAGSIRRILRRRNTRRFCVFGPPHRHREESRGTAR